MIHPVNRIPCVFFCTCLTLWRVLGLDWCFMFGSFKGKIVLSREKIMEIHLFLKYLPILCHHIVINVNFFFYNVKTKIIKWSLMLYGPITLTNILNMSLNWKFCFKKQINLIENSYVSLNSQIILGSFSMLSKLATWRSWTTSLASYKYRYRPFT